MKKELFADMRAQYSFLSSILYLVSIVFVVYKVFGDLSAPVRLGLFWIILLFVGINMTAGSFSYASSRRKLFYYQLYHPGELISAKLIFNFIKLLLAGIILFFLQYILSDSLIKDFQLFSMTFILGIIAITAVLTLVSSLSSYSSDQMGLVSILSLPLLIPVMLLTMRLSLISDRVMVDSASPDYLMMLGGIDLLLITLVIIFFPIIWKS